MRPVLPLVCAAGAALAMLLTGGALDAARAKASFQVTFGPSQTASGQSAAFLLTLHNSGSAASNLAPGAQVDVLFGTGDGPGHLVDDSEPIQATFLAPVGLGLDVQELTDSGGTAIGLQLFVTAPVEIPVGEAVVLEVRGVAGAPGTASVAVNARIPKSAGKIPKRTSFIVMKTPVVGEAQFFGDGSAGAFVASDGAVLQALGNYTDFLVPEGVQVSVPSGATIRCTGTFENRGTIFVLPAATGGGVQFDAPDGAQAFVIDLQLEPRVIPWSRGEGRTPAARPAVMDSQAVSGAGGGRGLGDDIYSLPLSHYRSGGGGGSGALGAIGGDGGGVLRVLARGAIYNGGSIVAAGLAPSVARDATAGSGGGGGAGGVVILGSATSVDNAVPVTANGAAKVGSIDVRGANGGIPDYLGGGGGGGGGGLVVFCAPSVRELEQTNPGQTLLDPGLNASASILGDQWPVQIGPPTIFAGGGGGGACVGHGGDGTGVQANGDIGPPPDPALPGRGQTIERRSDPRTLWN